jgi:hypothetical protein
MLGPRYLTLGWSLMAIDAQTGDNPGMDFSEERLEKSSWQLWGNHYRYNLGSLYLEFI